MKKLFQVIRSNEWWESKLSPLLTIGYATGLMTHFLLFKIAFHLILLLVAVIVGAVYVSVINDITDLEDDLAAGKQNRIGSLPIIFRWMIPAGCLLLGSLFFVFFFTNSLSRILYLLPWISFSLYSFPPVRLKKRGILGVFADASGSHLFISLLIVADVYAFTASSVNWTWFSAIGIWSFFYGLRGILWHQFGDREKDKKIHLKTFATETDPESFTSTSYLLFSVEIIAFVFMLFEISILIVPVFLLFYLVLTLLRSKQLNQGVTIIITKHHDPHQIFMLDYYQLFFPVSLLIYASFTQPSAWIILVVHIFLFNASMRSVFRDAWQSAKKLFGINSNSA